MTHNINKKISAEQGESSLQGASMDKPTAVKIPILRKDAQQYIKYLYEKWVIVDRLLENIKVAQLKSS